MNLGFTDMIWMWKESVGKTDSRPPPREAAPIHYTPYNGVIDGNFWQQFEQLSAELAALAGTNERLAAVQAKFNELAAAAKKAEEVHAKNLKKQVRRRTRPLLPPLCCEPARPDRAPQTLHSPPSVRRRSARSSSLSAKVATSSRATSSSTRSSGASLGGSRRPRAGARALRRAEADLPDDLRRDD